jgi:hypothetical protein
MGERRIDLYRQRNSALQVTRGIEVTSLRQAARRS